MEEETKRRGRPPKYQTPEEAKAAHLKANREWDARNRDSLVRFGVACRAEDNADICAAAEMVAQKRNQFVCESAAMRARWMLGAAINDRSRDLERIETTITAPDENGNPVPVTASDFADLLQIMQEHGTDQCRITARFNDDTAISCGIVRATVEKFATAGDPDREE